MAAIKSVSTKPEVYVRSVLHAAGFRFRLHRKDLPGSPDIVLARYKAVVLVQGCFWHGHGCKADHKPKTNRPYWSAKIERNVARDRRNKQALHEAGWHVFEVWECEIEEATQHLIEVLNISRRSQEVRT